MRSVAASDCSEHAVAPAVSVAPVVAVDAVVSVADVPDGEPLGLPVGVWASVVATVLGSSFVGPCAAASSDVVRARTPRATRTMTTTSASTTTRRRRQ